VPIIWSAGTAGAHRRDTRSVDPSRLPPPLHRQPRGRLTKLVG
jgi:hypothetical protein